MIPIYLLMLLLPVTTQQTTTDCAGNTVCQMQESCVRQTRYPTLFYGNPEVTCTNNVALGKSVCHIQMYLNNGTNVGMIPCYGTSCQVGQYSWYGVCTPCSFNNPGSYYCPGGFYRQLRCKSCAANEYEAGPCNATNDRVCMPCPTECPLGQFLTSCGCAQCGALPKYGYYNTDGNCTWACTNGLNRTGKSCSTCPVGKVNVRRVYAVGEHTTNREFWENLAKRLTVVDLDTKKMSVLYQTYSMFNVTNDLPCPPQPNFLTGLCHGLYHTPYVTVVNKTDGSLLFVVQITLNNWEIWKRDLTTGSMTFIMYFNGAMMNYDPTRDIYYMQTAFIYNNKLQLLMTQWGLLEVDMVLKKITPLKRFGLYCMGLSRFNGNSIIAITYDKIEYYHSGGSNMIYYPSDYSGAIYGGVHDLSRNVIYVSGYASRNWPGYAFVLKFNMTSWSFERLYQNTTMGGFVPMHLVGDWNKNILYCFGFEASTLLAPGYYFDFQIAIKYYKLMVLDLDDPTKKEISDTFPYNVIRTSDIMETCEDNAPTDGIVIPEIETNITEPDVCPPGVPTLPDIVYMLQRRPWNSSNYDSVFNVLTIVNPKTKSITERIAPFNMFGLENSQTYSYPQLPALPITVNKRHTKLYVLQRITDELLWVLDLITLQSEYIGMLPAKCEAPLFIEIENCLLCIGQVSYRYNITSKTYSLLSDVKFPSATAILISPDLSTVILAAEYNVIFLTYPDLFELKKFRLFGSLELDQTLFKLHANWRTNELYILNSMSIFKINWKTNVLLKLIRFTYVTFVLIDSFMIRNDFYLSLSNRRLSDYNLTSLPDLMWGGWNDVALDISNTSSFVPRCGCSGGEYLLDAVCTICPTGHRCVDSEKFACLQGTFSPVSASSTCQSCDMGNSSSYLITGCTSTSNAIWQPCRAPCGPGEYESVPCTNVSNRVCQVCRPGFFCPNGTREYQCTYCSGTVCANCVSGTYESVACTNTTDKVCLACTAGSFCVNNLRTTCTPTCTAGTYQTSTCTSTTNRICTPCPSYAYCADGLMRFNCSLCSPGWYESKLCDSVSNSICSVCPANSVCSNGKTAKTCSTCGTGKYMSAACTSIEDTKCSNCTNALQGYMYTGPGTTSINCPVSICRTCVVGQYEKSTCLDGVDTVCLACDAVPLNAIFVGIGTSSFNCPWECKPAHYLTDIGCSPCLTCSIGKYVSMECTMFTNRECAPCNNLPMNAVYVSNGTAPDNCMWLCNAGYEKSQTQCLKTTTTALPTTSIATTTPAITCSSSCISGIYEAVQSCTRVL